MMELFLLLAFFSALWLLTLIRPLKQKPPERSPWEMVGGFGVKSTNTRYGEHRGQDATYVSHVWVRFPAPLPSGLQISPTRVAHRLLERLGARDLQLKDAQLDDRLNIYAERPIGALKVLSGQ